MINHISYSRKQYVDTEEHTWPIPDMQSSLTSEYKNFIAYLPPEKQKWFSNQDTE